MSSRSGPLKVDGHWTRMNDTACHIEVTRRIPDSRLLTIRDAGHVAFQDQPELLMRSLLEFLG
ncbi:alpha/beta fold hydrolase [Sorangium sp. So ce1151]|uniref:alpha/beta fold hydrolase n=1 Tax=Sorangium sp. So ce1151 TaxID=3133332 RepID=UPI003F622730